MNKSISMLLLIGKNVVGGCRERMREWGERINARGEWMGERLEERGERMEERGEWKSPHSSLVGVVAPAPLAMFVLLIGLTSLLPVSPVLANTSASAEADASRMQTDTVSAQPQPDPSPKDNEAESDRAGGEAVHPPKGTERTGLPSALNLSSWTINFPGGLGLVQLPSGSENAEAYFDGRRVLVVRIGESRVALIGLNAKTEPGQYELELRQDPDSKGRQDAGSEKMLAFTVIARDYPTVKFDYPRKYSSYDKPTLARIGREKRKLTRLKKTWSPSKPDLSFVWPANGRISSNFGNRRVFQNRTSVHSGLDIARAIGTDVSATAPGIVLAAADYYFTGNTVLIDHGSGVLSLYAHLNDMTVKEGQKVAKGELIGHIGNTGRSTGPHLHFAIGFNGEWIDPITVLPAKPATK